MKDAHIIRYARALELPICMLYGDTRRGAFPSDVKAAVQYGKNLQSLAVALNTVGAVSTKRTHEILSGVFNIPIATGTISSMIKRCADSLGDTVSKIKDKMIGSALGHFDETGTRVDKKLWWVHDASNGEYTYLDISPKRGTAGMEQCGVLSEFKGIAMHDCRASYWNYPDIQHAVCCAHLLRELTGIDENHPEGMSAHDIKLMSDNDLLDMDYFLHEFDDDDDFSEEGFYLF